MPPPGDTMSGLLGQGQSLHFDMYTHFKRDKPKENSVFHRRYKTVRYRLARFNTPSLKTAPIEINNALRTPLKGSANSKEGLVFTEGELWRTMFDDTSPEVAFDKNTFTPVNLGQNTLFTRSAFWAIPPSTKLRTLSRLRWYFAVQKLMYVVGELTMLSSIAPMSYGFVIPRNRIQSQILEHDKFLKFIDDWKYENNTNLYHCTQRLIADMQKQKYLNKDEGNEIRKWVNFLDDINYKWVKPKPTHADIISEIAIRTRDSYDEIPPKQSTVNCLDKDMVSLYRSVFQKTQFYRKFETTVLIVVFNVNSFEAVPFANLIYRPMFKHIIYCGIKDTIKRLEDLGVDYVTYERNPGGSTFYNCLSIVMQMNLQIDGYMLIADDLLLNPSKLINVNLSQPIFFSIRPNELERRYNVYSLKFCSGIREHPVCNVTDGWIWPKAYQSQVRSTIIRFKLNARLDVLTRKAYENLRYNTGAEDVFYGEICDAAYVPQSLANMYITLNSIFLVKGVFMEIALPTIMHSLTKLENIQFLPSTQIPYSRDRGRPWTYWKKFKFHSAYLHPAKWGPILTKNDTRRRKFYCKEVMPFYINYLKTL